MSQKLRALKEAMTLTCHVCKATEKSRLTLYQFYSNKGKVCWRSQGEPGYTIRDGKVVCQSCAGVSDGVSEKMKRHNWMWSDGSLSAWRKGGAPYIQLECKCGRLGLFGMEAQAKGSGWVGSSCPKCSRSNKRLLELEEENKELKKRLARIKRLCK